MTAVNLCIDRTSCVLPSCFILAWRVFKVLHWAERHGGSESRHGMEGRLRDAILRSLKYPTVFPSVDETIIRYSVYVKALRLACIPPRPPASYVVFRWTIFRIFSVRERWGNETAAGRPSGRCLRLVITKHRHLLLGKTSAPPTLCAVFLFLTSCSTPNFHGGWWARRSEKFPSLSSVNEICYRDEGLTFACCVTGLRYLEYFQLLSKKITTVCTSLKMLVDRKLHCEISGFRWGVIQLFALLGWYAAYVVSWLPTFRKACGHHLRKSSSKKKKELLLYW